MGQVIKPTLVFILAAGLYLTSGFDGTLIRDNAIVVYGGQQMAAGVPPYVSIFDHKGPLAPMLVSVGVVAADVLPWDDVHCVRGVFLVLSCAAVVAVYLLGRAVFVSDLAGFFAALGFLCFTAFGRNATAGPNAKTPAVLFVALGLLLLVHRRWLCAGLCIALAGLAWQPTGAFAVVALVLALALPRAARWKAALRLVIGVAIPLVAVTGYYVAKGALGALIDGAVLFNLTQLERESEPWAAHLLRPIRALAAGFAAGMVAIFIGFAALVYQYVARSRENGSVLQTLFRDQRFAPVLLTFPLVVIWTILDFQWVADLYVFLPYVAIGFGWFAARGCQVAAASAANENSHPTLSFRRGGVYGPAIAVSLALIAVSWTALRCERDLGLREQRADALQVEQRYGRDASILSIGAPGLLVLLEREDLTPYGFIINGIDRRIEEATEGGFAAWVDSLAKLKPDIVAWGPTGGEHIGPLEEWLAREYRPEQVGVWPLFVRRDIHPRPAAGSQPDTLE